MIKSENTKQEDYPIVVNITLNMISILLYEYLPVKCAYNSLDACYLILEYLHILLLFLCMYPWDVLYSRQRHDVSVGC